MSKRPSARRVRGGAGEAQVIQLSGTPDEIRQLAQGFQPPTPELGQRTPQPQIQRWDRRRAAYRDLSSIHSVLRKAEQGETEELADLWLRMLKTDAHLKSVWETRVAPIVSSRWEVLPADTEDEALTQLAEKAANGVEEALKRIDDLSPLFACLLNGIGVGYSVAEVVWGRGRLLGSPAWVPLSILPVHARRFSFGDSWELGLYDSGSAADSLRKAGFEPEVLQGQGGQVVRLPASKYIVHQPNSVHDYPSATGLVFSVANWYWAKQAVTKYWLAGAETSAEPRFLGKLPQQASPEAASDLLDAMEGMASDGMAVVKGDVELMFLEAAKSGSPTWEALFNRMDLAMSKAVLGSTLNVEIGSSGGNRAASESQDDVTIRPRREMDARAMWADIRRDLFRYIIDFNPHLFPPGTPLPQGRSVLSEDPVEVDQLIVQSGVVTVDELRESRGLSPLGGEAGGRFIQPAPVAQFSASEGEAQVPLATSLSRRLNSAWTAATPTRSPSRTKRPSARRSRS